MAQTTMGSNNAASSPRTAPGCHGHINPGPGPDGVIRFAAVLSIQQALEASKEDTLFIKQAAHGFEVCRPR